MAYTAPPLEFELILGLEGISQHYDLNKEIYSRIDLQDVVREKYKSHPSYFTTVSIAEQERQFLEFAQPILQEIIERNPVLNDLQIDTDDPLHVLRAIVGIASHINVDDINWYIQNSGNKFLEGESARECTRIEELTGVRPYWHPSPATFKKIRSQIRDKGLGTYQHGLLF